MNEKIYDMLIVGGGPGGYTAALYAARAGMTVAVLEKLSAGGQMAESPQIDNYPGLIDGIDGFSLGMQMQAHAEKFGAETHLTEVTKLNLTDKIKTVLKKNVIYVFHSVEQADKDGNPIQRLMCEGSCRNTVWNPCDFGGYVQMIGNKRMICFSPTQEYFAKGTHGITGEMPIPVLNDSTPNDFMTKLFDKARQSIIAENEAYGPQKAKYVEVMGDVCALVESVKDQETANQALDLISNLEHALTSKKESGAMLNAKCKELGLKYSKETGGYVPKDGGQ
jgi:hypothetical protein